MLEDSWLSPHFQVIGNRSTHFGLFDCSNGNSNSGSVKDISQLATATSSSCGTGGGCCWY